MSEQVTEPVLVGGMTGAEIAEKRKRLIAEADAAQAEREKAETSEVLAHISSIAEAAIARFRDAPCGGSLEGLPRCTDAVERECKLSGEPSCPRQIRAFDESREAAKLTERLAEAGIPRALLEVALSPGPTLARTRVDDWLPGTERLLVLAGPPGVGKSVAAAYAIRRYRGTWVRASQIGKAQGFDGEAKALLYRLRNTRLLVIDDVGAENVTDFSRSALEDLVGERYDDGVRTILTTNLDAKTFKATYTARLCDRIAGEQAFHWVAGKSMRGAK